MREVRSFVDGKKEFAYASTQKRGQKVRDRVYGEKMFAIAKFGWRVIRLTYGEF